MPQLTALNLDATAVTDAGLRQVGAAGARQTPCRHTFEERSVPSSGVR